jgi:parallel beta-helix repeat protein
MNRKTIAIWTITVTLASAAAYLLAGPLNPPVGPVVSTHKTLTEVEPRTAINATNTPGDADSLYKITQPGSYYLTGNITGVVGKHGIEIAASGVTLDLNGFDLEGVPAMGAFDGVSATVASLTNIVVVNGSVRNWGQDGVNLGSQSVDGCRIEGVQASGNLRVGVYAGLRSQVSNCSGAGGLYGLFAEEGSTLLNCSATGSSIVGIGTRFGCTLSNCSASDNTGDGISIYHSSMLSNCSAYNNIGHGIVTGYACTLSNCSAYQNSGSGINVGPSCLVLDSTALFNNLNGIVTSSACTVTNCSAYENYSSGIRTAQGSTVTNCSACLNLNHGILAGDVNSVVGCTVTNNAFDGIRVNHFSRVVDNTCSGNGTAGLYSGIFAAGNRNVIEGNHVTDNDAGISGNAGFVGNVMIRNNAAGNTTNYSLPAANNIIGTIVNTSAAVNTATNSNVNISQ